MKLRLFAALACSLSVFAGHPAFAQNPGVVTIPDPGSYKQVIAISDVHGEYEHVEKLLRNANIIDIHNNWIAGKSLMVVVGDSIDKGPDSIKVLELWLQLESEAYSEQGRVVVLLGNHEAEFLSNPSDKKSAAFREEAGQLSVPLASLSDPTKSLGKFLHSLPLAARVGNWVFCHAGWIPAMPWNAFVSQAKAVLNAGNYGDPLLIADDSILEKKTGPDGKKWWRSKSEIQELEHRLDTDGLAGVVFGHQPKAFDVADNIGESIDGRMMKIDSGMAPVGPEENDGGQPYPGHLLIFTNPAELSQKGITMHVISVDSNGIRSAPPLEDTKKVKG